MKWIKFQKTFHHTFSGPYSLETLLAISKFDIPQSIKTNNHQLSQLIGGKLDFLQV